MTRWWVAAGFGLLSVGGALAETKVTVTAGDGGSVPVPLMAPTTLKAGSVKLAAANGSTAPAQVVEIDGKPRLVWIEPALASKESRAYTVEQGASPAKGVEVKETDAGLDVIVNGELFTTYQTKAGPKPYLWPINGPTGKPITRAYPMKRGVAGEAVDHFHHRSFWFTHGHVNEHNFWMEAPNAGKTVHREFSHIVSGPVTGSFTSVVDWVGRKGEKVCEDTRTFRFYAIPGEQLFDVELRVKATNGDLTFGDDKEGTFGFRVAGTMSVNARKGGTIVNAAGDRDGKTWGKRAAWCDYSGPVDGETVGVAIFDNPANLRHPTYWHVRDYGLFCANPFGLSFFTGDKKQNGSYTVKAGQEWVQRYRIYIHKGDAAAAKVAETFSSYASPPTVTVEN